MLGFLILFFYYYYYSLHRWGQRRTAVKAVRAQRRSNTAGTWPLK